MKVKELRRQERRNVFLRCESCGHTFNADADNYTHLDGDTTMMCCGKPLVRKAKPLSVKVSLAEA